MKKVLITMLAGLLLTVGGQAQAASFWVGDVQGFDGATNYYVPGVQGMDWSSSGSGLTVGLTGGPLAVGQTFDFLYQASLVGYTDPNGDPIVDGNLGTTYEYTIVAKLPEIVSSVINNAPVAGGQTAFFQSLPGGTFYIYRDIAPNSDVASGFGFDDGELAANGTISAGNFSLFAATVPGEEGIGSTILDGTVLGTFTNVFGDFFVPDDLIFGIRFEGTLNQPPLDSEVFAPGVFFASRAGEGNYAEESVIGWTQFKVDGSSKFVVPEPSTFLLLGAGLLGLAGISRKKMKK